MASIPPFPDEDHICGGCDLSYASITVPGAIDIIRELPATVDAATASVPDARLRRRPDERIWSALEYVCHLRDVYSVYTIRLHRARVEDRPVLEPMLNDLRAARFRYNRRALRPMVAELDACVGGLIDESARYSDADWDRVVTRLPGEQRTARWLIRQAAHEGIHHVRDISAVLHQIEIAT